VNQQEGLAAPFYLAGLFRQDAAGTLTPVSFPVNLAAGQRLVFYTQWVASSAGAAGDSLVLRGRRTGGVADNLVLNLSGTGFISAECDPDPWTICLNNDRFKVQAHFLTSSGVSGRARMAKLTGDTGYFTFFSESNVEGILKVLNGCSFNSHYWVFGAGLTNVRNIITYTDVHGNPIVGTVETFINGGDVPFAPIQDTSAFATCP
jgi:hypothetical protein